MPSRINRGEYDAYSGRFDLCRRRFAVWLRRSLGADPCSSQRRRRTPTGTCGRLHPWSHATRTNKNLTEDQRKDEIEKGFSAVKWALGGVSPSPFFRFPALQHPPEMVTYLGTRNIAMFSCDLDSFDFKARNAQQVIDVTMKKLDKLGKGIILLHDFHKHTAEALPELLLTPKALDDKTVQMRAKSPVQTLAQHDDEV